jgi:acetyl esterase/lipase
MKKSFAKKLITFPVAAGILIASMQPAFATAVNPFTNPQILNISGAEEAAYIDKKTSEFFSPSKNTPDAEYVVPNGWTQQKLDYEGVTVEKYAFTKQKTDRVLLFLHGGGYVASLNNIYRDWGIHQGELAKNATVYMPDYRIAPAYKHPSALEDAAAAYKGMLADGINPNNIIITGDSAGGNLTLALLLYLRDNNIPQPKAAVLISPWTSPGAVLPSHKTNLSADKMLGEKNSFMNPEIENPSYATDLDTTDPYLAPAYGNLTGLSPMLITAGGDEFLLDEAAIIYAHAEAAGVDAHLKIYKGMSHDWTIVLPELPESREMDKDITKFIDEHLK